MESIKIVEEISIIVEEECKKDTNIYGYGIWTHHIKAVVRNSILLAKEFNADLEVVELAALLHDYASIKNKLFYKEHHIYGAIEAENLLKTFNYPKEKIELIKNCIISHRGSVIIDKNSNEAKIIASADAMAHIDEIPSLFHLAYTKHKMNIDDGAEWVMNKIDRSWQKLCPEAKELMLYKYNSIKTILEHN